MSQLIAAVLPLALMVVFFIVPVYVISWLRTRYRKDRRSPLTAKLLRGPGQTLQKEISKVEDDFSAYLAILLMFPFLTLSVHLSQSYFGGAAESMFRSVFGVAAVVSVVVLVSLKLHRFSRTRFTLQCGFEAEVAMGQELNQLMRQGAVVFHDFPAEHFNIDHVVLTRGGLYAVETKGRMKPDKGRGAKDATVEFDGSVLLFPDWKDAKTLEQAKRQATWLAKWLGSAVGEPVSVRPVVALPGWFVNRTGRGDVITISGREAPALLKAGSGTPLSEQTVLRVAHQLEQRCRDVEPTQYGRQGRLGREVRERVNA